MDFACDLFKALLRSKSVQSNIVISPFVLESILTLMYLGAEDPTAELLKQYLPLKNFEINADIIDFFNNSLKQINDRSIGDTYMQLQLSMIFRKTINLTEEFKELASKFFLTYIEQYNPKQQLTFDINPLIKFGEDQLFNEIENGEGLLFLSNINFNHKWFLPFSEYRTKNHNFHTNIYMNKTISETIEKFKENLKSDLCIKSIPMMHDNEMLVKFLSIKDLDACAIELPFEHNGPYDWTMLLILPNQFDGLENLEMKLNITKLNMISKQMTLESVEVLLPKFEINYSCRMKPILELMGLKSIFEKDTNFSHLLNNLSIKPFYLSDIFHRVNIAIYETGSKPTLMKACTFVKEDVTIIPEHKIFQADHPFCFVIRIETLILLIGHVTNF